MNRHIRQVAERLTGTRIFDRLPGGVDFLYDLRRHLPRCDLRTIFDVGANDGQSAQVYLASYPNAAVYCFEPVRETYDRLVASLGARPNVRCFHVALSSTPGTGTMELEGKSVMYRLVPPGSSARRTEAVALDTLDDFCARNAVSHIDLLKIDTEGHDLDVLKGSERMLAGRAVDIIQVEAGMNPRNERHVSMESLKGYLEPLGYFLFRIYDQVPEFPTQQPNLRRSNLVFTSEDVIMKNRGTRR